jgi:hypothetical protein
MYFLINNFYINIKKKGESVNILNKPSLILLEKKIKSTNLSVKMNKNIIKTLESSSIHAIPNIIRTSNLLIKSIWTICFIGSSGVCGWFILNSINKYFMFEVVSKIDIKYETPLIFPVVSICDLNPITTKQAEAIVNSSIEDSYPDFKYLDEIIIKLKQNTINQPNLTKSLLDKVINCEFVTKLCDLDKDFEPFFDANYGYCVRFNSGKNMKGENVIQKFVSNTGTFNSLDLEIFVGSSIQNTNVFSKKNGLNIFISNSSTNSFYGEGIQISPGTSTNIILNKYSVIKQSSPYSECIKDLTSIHSFDSQVYKKLISSKSKYNYADCVQMCYQKLLSKNCECQSTFYDFVYNDTLRNCLFETAKKIEDSKCIYDNWQTLSINPNILKECNCPFECEIDGYQHSTSFSEFPTKYYFDYLTNKSSFIKNKYPNITFEEMKQSVAKIQIFYDELKHTVISEEVKVDMEELISNIGGILGLFLGNI